MSTNKKDILKSMTKKWIYSLFFTTFNLLGVYLIVNEINWLLIVLISILILLGFYTIFADTFESVGTKFDETITDSLQPFLLPITVIAIILIAFVDKLLPGGVVIKKLINDHILILTPALIIIAVVIVIKRDYKFKKIIDSINEINNRLVKYNPLYSTELTFRNAIEDLQKVSIKDVALDFSIDSLKQMGSLGFIKIDVSFGSYTQKLFDIVEKSKSSVLGTFTFRPKFIHDKIQSNADPINNTNLKYLKLLNDKKYSNKVRLRILSIDEIQEILNNALQTMKNSKTATLLEL